MSLSLYIFSASGHLEHPPGLGDDAAAAEEADHHDDQTDEHENVDAGPVVLHAQALHPLLEVLIEPDPQAEREYDGTHQLWAAGSRASMHDDPRPVILVHTGNSGCDE